MTNPSFAVELPTPEKESYKNLVVESTVRYGTREGKSAKVTTKQTAQVHAVLSGALGTVTLAVVGSLDFLENPNGSSLVSQLRGKRKEGKVAIGEPVHVVIPLVASTITNTCDDAKGYYSLTLLSRSWYVQDVSSVRATDITTKEEVHHVVVLDSQAQFDAWATALAAVHAGLHQPPPPQAILTVDKHGISIASASSASLASSASSVVPDAPPKFVRYSYIAKFEVLSERTVAVHFDTATSASRARRSQLAGFPETMYFRSLEGRAREIVAAMTEKVRVLIEEKERKHRRSSGSSVHRHRHRSHGSSHQRHHKGSRTGSRAASTRKADDASSSSFSYSSGDEARPSRPTRRLNASSSSSSSSTSSSSDTSSSSSSDSADDADAPLPDDWREASAPDGAVYYYHVRTKETSWIRPKVVKEKEKVGGRSKKGKGKARKQRA